jgi:hypothetical protein
VPCKDAWLEERAARREVKGKSPGIPVAVMELIKSHRRIVHKVTSMLAWFEKCPECERLEALYVESQAFHTLPDGRGSVSEVAHG